MSRAPGQRLLARKRQRDDRLAGRLSDQGCNWGSSRRKIIASRHAKRIKVATAEIEAAAAAALDDGHSLESIERDKRVLLAEKIEELRQQRLRESRHVGYCCAKHRCSSQYSVEQVRLVRAYFLSLPPSDKRAFIAERTTLPPRAHDSVRGSKYYLDSPTYVDENLPRQIDADRLESQPPRWNGNWSAAMKKKSSPETPGS